MKISEYQKMADLEDHYWWHVGRKSIIKRELNKISTRLPSKGRGSKIKILNIGCGTGGTIQMLEQFGKVYNIDVSKDAINFARRRGAKNLRLITGSKLPFESNSFDILVALDVLEHIKNESYALKEWFRVLKPDGRIIITVPAYQWLWSGHDESLHHFRRYTISELCKNLNEKGFQITKRSYIIVFSFTLIVGYRILTSVFRNNEKATSYIILPRPINGFFILLLKAEGKMLNIVNFPFGTSVLVEAKK